jgi:hypothetical protein
LCFGKIDWHHNLTSYENGNKGRTNDIRTILPVCQTIHDKARRREIKELLDYIMFFVRGLDPSDYPKSDLVQRKKYIHWKFLK